MKKWLIRTAFASAGVALLAALAVVVMGWLRPEPHAQGRPLSEWLDQLRDSKPEKREEAVAALHSLGPKAVPFLIAELKLGPNLLERAAQGTSNYAPDFLKGPLNKVFSEQEVRVRKHTALHAIGLLGTNGAAAVPAVGEMLRSRDVGLISAAATALIRLGTNSLPELIASLDDGSYDTRSHACQVLSVLGSNSAPAVPRLGQILEDERGAVTAAAGVTLSRIGEPAVAVLSGLLDHTNAPVRQQAALSLANMGMTARPALEQLWEITEDEDSRVRWAAVNAVAAIDRTSRESATVLMRALDDPHVDVRVVAANAAKFRPRMVRENQEKFRELLEDESVDVRAAAAQAIGQTGHHGQWAIPHLVKMLEHTNLMVRDGARYALATITNSVELVRGGPLVPRVFGEPGSERRIEVRDQ